LEIFPQADIYTSIFWQEKNPIFAGRNITISFIQKIPFLNKSHKMALTLRPLAFESFDLSQYDIVISSSSAESKGVITKPDCLHICYCHTPTRYFWSHYHEYMSMMEFGILNPLAKWLMPKLIHTLRKWDFCAAQRPDYFLANSENTKNRIKKYYNREAKVLYPGIDIFPPIELSPKGRKSKLQQEDFYLAVGRCIPYKKFDLLIEAFNQNGKKLICVTNTDNKLYQKLKKISGPNIEWKLGISRNETQELFASAKAFLFPPEEDFGLVPLEAMAHGTPVIAYGKGGALETVITPYPTFPHGEKEQAATGLFFMEQTVESLNAAIEQFETMQFESKAIKAHAASFSKEVFQEKFVRFIEEKLSTIK
jgi:glycosyltransferase involved in cell wall biosynthesis